MSWTEEIVQSRVMDGQKQLRYSAGSPNKEEVELYAKYLPHNCEVGVVMGMTPELRNMAAEHCDLLISIDISQAAIEIYRDWLKPEFQQKEKIIHGDWNDLEHFLDTKPGFIIGDGIFGNITPLVQYTSLLKSIRAMLPDTGSFITRQCLMPDDVITNINYHKSTLIKNFRKGMMDEAEFGLSMRLQGYAEQVYDKETALLNNKKVFEFIEIDYKNDLLSDKEYQIIHRYFFQGINSLPTKKVWEQLLTEAGFSFEYQELTGKNWYEWYPIYYFHSLTS